jgi:hypothetical protein
MSPIEPLVNGFSVTTAYLSDLWAATEKYLSRFIPNGLSLDDRKSAERFLYTVTILFSTFTIRIIGLMFTGGFFFNLVPIWFLGGFVIYGFVTGTSFL